MKESGSVLIKTIIGSLSDEELMELAKPIDDVDLDKLPTVKKILGLDKDERNY
jgi:hypothetical protein